MYALGYPIVALVNILDALLLVYSIVVVAAVIVSWVNPDPYNAIVRLIQALTEPVFAALRRYVPVVNGLDLAPLVAILLILFVRGGILPVIGQTAERWIVQ